MRRVVEIYEAYTAEDANKKLREGWRLHAVFGTPEKRVYVLTLLEEAKKH